METKTRILIVDDEPINLDFFEVMLTKLGFDVERAEDGEEALEKVKSYAPDLLILDNVMPKLSGWTVTRLLKSHEDYAEYREIPIIMFSAMDKVEDKIEGFELGVDDYITKPFNFSEVLARIRAVLRHRTLAKQIVRKEKRIALIESLNESLLFFTQHLKGPVMEIQKRSMELDRADSGQIADFVELVSNETGEVLATLSGLEEEIRELRERDAEVERESRLLQELDEKFQKHFEQLKQNQQNVSADT